MNTINQLIASIQNKKKNTSGETAVNKVTNYIKNKIILKELRAGDKIPSEAELCQILNVSRGSVREAVKILEAMEIIDVRRGDGTYITHPAEISFFEPFLFKMILNDMELNELVAFREQIEIAALHLAVLNAEQKDLEALKDCNAKFSTCVQKNSSQYETLHQLDLQFHQILASSMKNKLMKEIYFFAFEIFSPMILENYRIGQVYSDQEMTLKSHSVMIEAIEKRDFFTGVYGVRLAMNLWKKWIEKQKDSTI